MSTFARMIFVVAVLLSVVGCHDSQPMEVPEGYRSEVMLGITPVKDQGRSELCWVYAMLATIETEHLMQGDSVNLSTDYIARMYLEEQARQRYLSQGEKEITMRGMAPMTVTLLLRYGLLPYDSYHAMTPVNYNVLKRKVEKTVDRCLSGNVNEERCMTAVRRLLDDNIGYLPQKVFMYGMTYSFLEFAHSVCLADEYAVFTSLSSYATGKRLRLPFPDNHYGCEAMNLPGDTIVSIMESALRQGHPVMWEGGLSDDHAVSVVGMGTDSTGEEYFVAKNSWGKDNPTSGMLYIRKDYVRDHTAVICVKNIPGLI